MPREINDSQILIGQYYGTSLVSRLIRWRTWSDISHTAAFVGATGDEVIEAWEGSVRRQSWKVGHASGTRIEIYRVPCTLDQRREFYNFLSGQIGKPYDYSGILGFMLRAKTESKDSWFCSELVFSAARAAGIDLLSRIEPYQVSPGDLNVSPLLEPVEVRFAP
jgi:uncharacterized protein YycO